MGSTGRGANYSRTRGVLERIARVAYKGGWPGRLWGRVPGRTVVDLVEHALPILPSVLPSVLSPALPPALPSAVPASAARAGRTLRIAFASDLHIGPLTPPALLDNAFARLRDARPDVLVLGGDYVFLEATTAVADELAARVAAVPAPIKLAVLGNHDLWTHHGRLEAALASAGARVLVNEAVRLPPPFEDVAFFGLDDPWSGVPDAAAALAATGDAALRLGIAHSPEAVPMLRGHGVELLLCGHTHGGQIALPSGPIVVHGKVGRVFPAGLFDLGDLRFFVSRGLGAVELPFRVHARPDVSVFTLSERPPPVRP